MPIPLVLYAPGPTAWVVCERALSRVTAAKRREVEPNFWLALPRARRLVLSRSGCGLYEPGPGVFCMSWPKKICFEVKRGCADWNEPTRCDTAGPVRLWLFHRFWSTL